MAKYISEPDDVLVTQSRLFSTRKTLTALHPPILQDEDDLEQVLRANITHKGIDLEFRRNLTPTIVSVTTPDMIASVRWSENVAEMLKHAFMHRKTQWVAHSGISADKPVIEQALDISTPLDIWEDSMITHFLCNQCLTKAPGKEESDDAGALGFMDLWTMASMTTPLYNWKRCRGPECDGPCPLHQPIEYCGLDSWAGLMGFLEHLKIMERRGIPYSFYREQMATGEICWLMETRGIKIDAPLVQEMQKNHDIVRQAIFPNNEPFNPKSDKQVIAWFGEHGDGLVLTDNQKTTVEKLIERLAKKYGCDGIKEFDEFVLAENELKPAESVLYRLYQFKVAGKGFDPWFGDKYLDKNGYVHPRFIYVGTTTGRLSSSSPNLQNVPHYGFGDLVRRAIIPRSPDMELLKSDSKQLELRVGLYLAGEDAAAIGSDAFNWLVSEAKGQFEKASEYADPKTYAESPAKAARKIAKIVSYASLYMTGFKLYDRDELKTKYRRKEIDNGALRVYTKEFMPELENDWTFFGKVVAFTGKRLAEILFQNYSLTSREKALRVQEDVYFKRFFSLREWQMRFLWEVEQYRSIKTPTGRHVELYGDPESIAKAASSVLGQGVGADHIQSIMRRYKREKNVVPLIQVHDELVFEIPKAMSDDEARDFISLMGQETDLLPGLIVPADSKRGPNWKDLREI